MDAKVNFGAAKLTVVGNATIEQLEKAGAFDRLRIAPENANEPRGRVPFWRKKENARLFVSALFLIAGWLAATYVGEGSFISISFYLTSIVIGGFRLFKTGLENLTRLRFDMKTLMTVAVIGAAAIGEWGEGATVVILFAISEALETYSMDKARQSIRSLIELFPKVAWIRRGGEETLTPVDDIKVGDIMIVKPGEKLAMDGKVIKGASMVQQAAITGESIPVAKNVGDEVYAGTLNGEGLLEVRVTKTFQDTTLSKIIHLVEEAQAERAPSQAFVDRFAKYYTPAIMIVALLIALIPPLWMNAQWSEWIYRGLATLVVGCPCALVISTPVAIVTAIGHAANRGVLIKGGIHLEEAGALSVIAFDKTGTLTKGVPEVTDVVALKEANKEEECLALAAALEKRSQHPLAAAILREANHRGLDYRSIPVEDFFSITGKGMKGKVNGTFYYAGSPALFEELLPNGIEEDDRAQINALQKQGKTAILIGTEKEALLLIAMADEVRENSQEVVKKLHQLGVQKTVMLTGDNEATAQTIAKQLAIGETRAELLPQQKLAYIEKARGDGFRVAMVGDGVNDAPALAAANVGIAMGGAGSDTALETADIALMGDDLSKLPFTIRLSRKTMRIIQQNIAFSIAIKAIALIFIFPGWLALWMAIFADLGATLIVTMNGLRLLTVKDNG